MQFFVENKKRLQEISTFHVDMTPDFLKTKTPFVLSALNQYFGIVVQYVESRVSYHAKYLKFMGQHLVTTSTSKFVLTKMRRHAFRFRLLLISLT